MLSIVSTLETGLAVALAANKIPPADYQIAITQVADVRAAIAASETQPVSAADLLNRVLALAATWAIVKESGK